MMVFKILFVLIQSKFLENNNNTRLHDDLRTLLYIHTRTYIYSVISTVENSPSILMYVWLLRGGVTHLLKKVWSLPRTFYKNKLGCSPGNRYITRGTKNQTKKPFKLFKMNRRKVVLYTYGPTRSKVYKYLYVINGIQQVLNHFNNLGICAHVYLNSLYI